MLTKHISLITFEDIYNLIVTSTTQEGHHLDFKEKILFGEGKPNAELSKDFSAFANANGGYIIFGVSDDLNIIGLDQDIHVQKSIERLHQVLSDNIEPPIFYYDPKVINVPESDRQLLVVQIPESKKKPHLLKPKHSYFVRINDSSKPANHYQIRDMFDLSRIRSDEITQFFQRRKLLDDKETDFGMNSSAAELMNNSIGCAPHRPNRPCVIYSILPSKMDDKMVSISSNELKTWLDEHKGGYFPKQTADVLIPDWSELRYKLDGLIYNLKRNGGAINSYFELLENGYIECGFSDLFCACDGHYKCSLHLTHILTYNMLLLSFAKDFFTWRGYFDELIFQISFVDVYDMELHGHKKSHDRHARPRNGPCNKYNQHFKIIHGTSTSKLDNEEITKITQYFSERICRAFGLDKDYGFENGELDPKLVRSFRSFE